MSKCENPCGACDIGVYSEMACLNKKAREFGAMERKQRSKNMPMCKKWRSYLLGRKTLPRNDQWTGRSYGEEEMIKTYGQQQTGKQPSEAAEMTTFNQLQKRYPEIMPWLCISEMKTTATTREPIKRRCKEVLWKVRPILSSQAVPAFLCEMKSKG